MQVLNGAIAAALFNLLYDVVLSQKVKWYALCCVIDFMNHSSKVQARILLHPSGPCARILHRGHAPLPYCW